MAVKTKPKNGIKYIVTLAVKNGPFKTKEAAEHAQVGLRNKGVSINAPVKTASGYVFTSKLGYGVPNTSIRDKVISKLRLHAKSAKVPQSAISVSTRRV